MSAPKEKAGATRRPWVCSESQPGIWHINEAGFVSYEPVATCWTTSGVKAEVSAKRIVRAVNAHSELLAVAHELLALFGDADTISDSEGVIRLRRLLEHPSAVLRDIPSPAPRQAIRSASPESARAEPPAAARTLPAGAPP